MPGTGWSLQNPGAASAWLYPDGGVISEGSQALGTICMGALTADEQVVEIKYYGLNGTVICRDTLRFYCTNCVQASVQSAYCETWGVYNMDFCVKAGEGLDFNANSAVLVAPPGVTFTPNRFSLPSLAPGDTYCTLTTEVSGAIPGSQVCFTVILHDQDVAAGEPDLVCCNNPIEQCFTMPECNPCSETYATATQTQINGDSCCWDITLHNPPNFFQTVRTSLATPGWTFNLINNAPGSGWLANLSGTNDFVDWTPVPPQGNTIQTLITLPTVCFENDGSGNIPHEMAVSWLGLDSTYCIDSLYFDCPVISESSCVIVDNSQVECVNTGGYTYTFTVKNQSQFPAFDAGQVSLIQIPVENAFSPSVFNSVVPIGSSSTYSTHVNGNPGDQVCFYAVLHELNDTDLHINCCPTADTICITLPFCTAPNLSINAFPNPASDWLNLVSSAPLPATSVVHVLDMTGRIRWRSNLPAGTHHTAIDLSKLDSGMYVVDIRVAELVLFRKRFVVQRLD
jgi:hypothetical protein